MGRVERCRLLLGVVLVLGMLAACDRGQQKAPVQSAVPVRVDVARLQTVPVQLRAVGTVTPYSTVAVKSQVSAEVLKVHFSPGDGVRKGQLLFSLDPRPYQAALDKARADLAQDVVKARNAGREAGRYHGLVAQGIVTAEQYEQLRTAADALDAAVQADRAAVENARVALGYCSIRSPLSGRTGDLQLHAGNIVKANADTAMVTINQIAPIYVAFSVPEQELPTIRRHLRSGPLAVTALIPGDSRAAVQGRVSFLDNTVDTGTGTILLKGTFANRDGRLWPGQFVNIVLTLDREPDRVVVPSQAVQTGQQGDYVFVVRADRTVAVRPVKTGISFDGRTVIASGLAAGETVVTDGQLRLSPGVGVQEVAAPKTAETHPR